MACFGSSKHGLLRIVDESGEDYLYPKASFRSIALPHAVKKGGSGRLAATAPGKVAAPAILAESGIDVLLPSPSDYQTSR